LVDVRNVRDLCACQGLPRKAPEPGSQKGVFNVGEIQKTLFGSICRLYAPPFEKFGPNQWASFIDIFQIDQIFTPLG
jgi:hypothetical protein